MAIWSNVFLLNILSLFRNSREYLFLVLEFPVTNKSLHFVESLQILRKFLRNFFFAQLERPCKSLDYYPNYKINFVFLLKCFSSTFHDLFLRETFNGMKNVFKAFVKCEIMSGRRPFLSLPPQMLSNFFFGFSCHI